MSELDVLGKEHDTLDDERAVLSAILYHADEYDKLEGLLLAKHFSKSSHQVLFSCLESFMRSNQVEIDEFKEHLLQHGQLEACGGEEFLKQLKDSTQDCINIKEKATLIRSKYVLRKYLSTYHEMGSKLDDGCDIIKLLEKAEKVIHGLIEEVVPKSSSEMVGSVMAQVYSTLQDNYKRAESITGISTGCKAVDEITLGLKRGELIVVGGRPSAGKTAWLINLAHHIAIHEKEAKKVAFFTFEMSNADLGMRMLSVESRVDIKRMCSGQLTSDDWRKLATATGSLVEANIYMNDSCASVAELRMKCQKIKRECNGLDLVLVDYLQIMDGNECMEDREQQLVDIMRSLKHLATELDMPVVIASQMNRELEERADKRPMLSDFREALAIDQYADVVMFIYRDEMYYERDSNKGKAEIIIAKNCSGGIGSTELVFLNQCTRFENLPDGMHLDEQFIYENWEPRKNQFDT